MTEMQIREEAISKVRSRLFITGSARSGTTITGKLIHSMEGVEYAFEPPALISLFSLIYQIPKEAWVLLLQTYLYEEFYCNAIAGRNLNFRQKDDSCIYHVKDREEIHQRMSGNMRKTDIEKMTDNGIIAFKIPDVVPFLERYLDWVPEGKILFTRRNPVDTINSLLKKHWFSNQSLNFENRIYPIQKYNGHHIPYWVPEADFDLWIGMNEIDRCAYYFLKMDIPPDDERIFVLDYDMLIGDPEKTVNQMSEFLKLNMGIRTPEIVRSIKKSQINRDEAIIEKVSPGLREQIYKDH